jgi:hypothetical protein
VLRPGLTALAAAFAGLSLSVAPAVAATGVTMTISKVSYDGAPGVGCKAPLPGTGGGGSAFYTTPDGMYTNRWDWSVPATLKAGSTAKVKVFVSAQATGGYSGSIGIATPFEFGANQGNRSQIGAFVPVGQTGSANDQETYRFRPTRRFRRGEKLYLRVGFSCANYIYEYTGVGVKKEKPPKCRRPKSRAVVAAAGCRTVKFSFAIDGFPAEPDKSLLPVDLVGVELSTSGTQLTDVAESGKLRFGNPEGTMTMTNTYLQPTLATVERRVTWKLAASPFSRYVDTGAKPETRFVGFLAIVTASDDPQCPTGQEASFTFGLDRGQILATLAPLSGGNCLVAGTGRKGLRWNRPAFKNSAKLGRP